MHLEHYTNIWHIGHKTNLIKCKNIKITQYIFSDNVIKLEINFENSQIHGN